MPGDDLDEAAFMSRADAESVAANAAIDEEEEIPETAEEKMRRKENE